MPETTLPKALILSLRDQFKLTTFIEGGTFLGTTTTWAASHFEQVITVEMSAEIYTKTRERLKNLTNVSFVLGNTRTAFSTLPESTNETAIFWLDAHWSGENTYGEMDECPLLDEIRILLQSPRYPFLIIDDARLFLSPPPLPHRLENWPSIDQVISALKAHPESCYIAICNDVILAVPQKAKTLVSEYCQRFNTEQWYARPDVKAAETPRASVARRIIRKLRTVASKLTRIE